jgi:hypothetical protein
MGALATTVLSGVLGEVGKSAWQIIVDASK